MQHHSHRLLNGTNIHNSRRATPRANLTGRLSPATSGLGNTTSTNESGATSPKPQCVGASTMAPTLHEPRTCNGTMTGRYHSMYPFGGLPAATKTRSASLRSEMQPPHERQKDTWKSAAFAMAPHTQRHHPQTSAIRVSRSQVHRSAVAQTTIQRRDGLGTRRRPKDVQATSPRTY